MKFKRARKKITSLKFTANLRRRAPLNPCYLVCGPWANSISSLSLLLEMQALRPTHTSALESALSQDPRVQVQ